MADSTTATEEVTPPSAETTQPSASAEPTETVEELKEKLAAAEEDAKRWKNRVASENPKKKAEPVTEDDIDWKLKFNGRVERVKEQFEKELDELQATGAKLTNALKTKALEYAEKIVGVNNVSPSNPIPSAGVDRSTQPNTSLTETDIAMGIKPETVAKFRDFVER